MDNLGSMVKVLSKESAKDYVLNVLHMDKVRSLLSPDTDYWFFKGKNENGDWMEIRIERKPNKHKLHNVSERKWEALSEGDFTWIDALPEWNIAPSDDVDSYLPKE
ncbi:hypothetical protein J40TS1_33850 [Paenibacillus montaniterrae]|uniref:Uncharacterized protein n=1 Tax=Paenibacillus montaniterrae TaxID=429341 RepID=A0A919YPN2_9BACL|nr:hypothetical protein [Paenibacillus montaniterrae]GIP17743.1 hypothetical protein J40TS1_33850 [Paenibacillus montaniterrae]